MIGEKQPNCAQRMNRSGGDWLKLVSWYPPTSCPQMEYPLIAADCPATITLGKPLLPKLGSLSPAQYPGKACEPAKPLLANRTPDVPSTPQTARWYSRQKPLRISIPVRPSAYTAVGGM